MNNSQAQQAAELAFPIQDEKSFIASEEYPYSVYVRDMQCHRTGFIAGRQSSQTPAALPVVSGGEKMYRWVCAAERLPKFEEMISCKDNLDHPRLGNFFENTDGRNCFAVIGTEMYAPYTISENNFSHLFWLEEVSPSQLPSQTTEK